MSSNVTLDVRHHTFLQAIMSRGPLSEEIIHKMYKSLLKVNTLEAFNSFLGELNKELEFVDMEVKKVTNQNDGKEYFGIINKLASPQAKLGTKYSTAQISFFKAVMEAIVLDSTGGGCMHSSRALYLKPSEALQVDPTKPGGSQVGVPIKMTLAAKEEALELLVKDQWLSRTLEGGVSLGTRAFLELRGLFRILEVPFCEVCNEAAIKAELCRNDECPVRVHSYCLAKTFRARQARVCSRCQTEWTTRGAENGHAAENGHDGEESQAERREHLQSKGNNRRRTTLERPERNSRPSQPLQDSQNSTPLERQERKIRPRLPLQHSRDQAAMNGFPDDEEEDTWNEEEITRIASEDDREESLQPRKRILRKRN